MPLAVLLACLTGCGNESRKEQVDAPVSSKVAVSDVLSKWRYDRLISLACRERPLAEAAAEISLQSGLKVGLYPFQTDPKKIAATPVTLTLKDAPFWRAIGEVSKVSGVGFKVGSGEANIERVTFSGDLPPLKDDTLVGPLLVGIVRPAHVTGDRARATLGPHRRQFEILKDGGRAIRLRFVWQDGLFRDKKPPVIVLTDADGKDLGDAIRGTAGEMGLYDGEVLFHAPEALAAKATGFRGHIHADIVYDPQTLELPLAAGRVLDRGGLHATITGIKAVKKGTEIRCRITWDTGLRGDDARYLEDILKGEVPLPKAMQWLEKTPMITHSAISVEILNADGKPLRRWSSSTSNVPDHVSGSYLVKEKVTNDMILRVKLGRKVSGKVPFAFPNALK